MLKLGGGPLVALAAPAILHAAGTEVIEMRGTARGEHVWFAPLGLAVATGRVLRFVNRDPGNSHTSTCYHPALHDRPRRIPEGATPWDSGFLLPDEGFEVRTDRPGVYDYYCIPHEQAGMVGRIVVGRPGDDGWQGAVAAPGDLPDVALAGFPDIGAILDAGRVMSPGRP